MCQKNLNIPLIMTSSISTNGMKGACFTDEERIQMYGEALKFYIKTFLVEPERKIVFVENSGYPLHKFLSSIGGGYLVDNQQIEFLSLPFSEFDISKGKGYNEAVLISLANKQSKFISTTGNFFKVTGRYPIYNINFFYKSACKAFSKGAELYCDIKDHKLYDLLQTGWNGHSFDCRIFASTVNFWDEVIKPDIHLLNDYEGLLLEDLMFKNCRNVNKSKSLRFKREPHFGGLEGSENSTISFSKNQDSLKAKFKRGLGNGIRILTPWFWF